MVLYARRMAWEHLFEDLEDQLASGWEAQRAALDAESERLRIARLELRTRLGALARSATTVTATLVDATTIRGRLCGAGADWAALVPAGTSAMTVLPLTAVTLWGLDHGAVLDSSTDGEPLTPLQERMTLGFVLRDLVRRRAGVTVRIRGGLVLAGTIDRAGADHLDLALHDAGMPRRTQAVQGFRLIPLEALLSVRTEGPSRLRA